MYVFVIYHIEAQKMLSFLIGLIFLNHWKVWDNMIIESALKTYYNKSLPLMIQALQANLTVRCYFLYGAPMQVRYN